MYMGSLAGGHDAQVRDTARCKPRTRTHAQTRALVSVCVVRERDAVTLAGVQSDDRGRVLREFVKEAAAGASWMVEVVGDSQQPQVALSVTAEGLEAVEGDDLPEGEYCECSAKQKKLLEDWLVALERDKPGLLTRLRQERAVALKKLREEREEKQPWKKALWAEMEGANVVNPKETASTGGAFSFGFSVAGGTSS